MTKRKYNSQILTPKEAYVFDYPWANEYEAEQRRILWNPEEFEVSKDVQDLMVNMTEAESHGLRTVLSLFTKYELIVGEEYWTGIFRKMFNRPDFVRMGSCFGYVELNVHAPFYNKVDEALMLNTEEHYLAYKDDPDLSARVDFIDKIVGSKHPLLSVGGFCMTEGCMLYSNFAFIKHFNSGGKNLIRNVVSGINMSVNDENLHSEAGAMTYRVAKDEMLRSGDITREGVQEVEQQLIEAAETIYEHECRIIEMIFEKGTIKGITAHQMQNFVKSRLDLCLSNLGIGPIYNVEYNPIADWFYDNINKYQFNDMFNNQGREYNREVREASFTWQTS